MPLGFDDAVLLIVTKSPARSIGIAAPERIPTIPTSRSFVLILGACAVAAACSRTERAPDLLLVGLEGSPQQLDPRFSLDAYSSRVGTLLYAGLLRTTPDGATEPALAEAMEVPSPTRYRLRLREGLRFHDGSPLEAADVAATIDSILDPAIGSPKAAGFALVERIETPDPRTVEFRLRAPHAPFPVALTIGIVPRAWRHRGAGGDPPPGTGPFRLESWERDRALRLARFDGYYEGPALLEGVEFRVVPDPTVALLKLKAGELDLLQNMVNPDHLKALARMEDLQVVEADGVNYSYLGFNLEDPVVGDRRVRRAVAHAIDRRAIVEHLLRGAATPATGLLAPSNWAYAAEVPTYAYDPARARALLDEAGYRRPRDGGPRLRINYKTSTNPERRQIAEVFQHQLAEVGIEVAIESLEFGTFFGQIKDGNFQMYSLTWVGTTEPDLFYNVFHSGQTPPVGANRGRYRNPEMDALVEAARVETDREKRKALYAQVQRLAAEDLPYVSLWWSKNVVVARADLQGFVIYPGGDYLSLKDATLGGLSPAPR